MQQELSSGRVIGSEEEADERRARMHEKGSGKKTKWKKSEVTRGEQQAESKDHRSCVSGKLNTPKENQDYTADILSQLLLQKGSIKPSSFVLPKSSPLLTTGALWAQYTLPKH